MSQVIVPSKILQIGAEKQRQLHLIQDELKLAIRDYTQMIALLKVEPQNTFAKAEVGRLESLIGTLAEDQKVILRDIRKKPLEPAVAEPVEPNTGAAHEITSSKEKENESVCDTKALNPPIKVELDKDTGNGPKKDPSEVQEPDHAKCLLSVAPLGERPKHVDNMLPNNDTANVKPRSLSPAGNMKGESANDSTGMVKFLRLLGLMPVKDLKHALRTKERKRATRQKRSTANHSQFIYDDSWDQDDKKKRKKEKETPAPVPLKATKPVPEIIAEAPLPPCRKRDTRNGYTQLVKLEKITQDPKPKVCTMDRNKVCKSAASILEPSKKKLTVPKPGNIPAPSMEFKKPYIVRVVGQPTKKEPVVPPKTRKVVVETKRKRGPQKKPIDFSLDKQPIPGWNTTIVAGLKKEKNEIPSSINSLIQASHTPSGLAIKIAGLPSSLTIERISEQQRVCCMCRKPALMTGIFGDSGEKISDALTSCSDCAMSYHLSCTRSTTTSNEFHVCPHCFTCQDTYPFIGPKRNASPNQPSAKVSRSALILERIRLATEKETLEKKLIDLGVDVTCTFTRGGKSD